MQCLFNEKVSREKKASLKGKEFATMDYEVMIKKFDKKFQANNFNGEIDKKDKSYQYLQGKVPVLISAPHSVKQIRNGKEKLWDGFTGALSQVLYATTNCHTIYKKYNDGTDANYDLKDNGYKDKVLKIIKEHKIKIFIDLHAAAPHRKFDIDIATDYQNTLNGNLQAQIKLIEILKKHNIKNVKTNHVFTATNPNTVTKNTSIKTNIPCMELEINSNCIMLENLENFVNIINALKEFIGAYK